MYKFLPYMTNDGSVGLYNDSVNDIYHSAFGALTEAYEKFVEPAKDILGSKKNIRVLDICYGIGYNTKAFMNELLKTDLSDKTIKIDCVDNNKTLIELSPFIKSDINFFSRLKYKSELRKNISNYDEAKKITSLKINNKKNYKIHDIVNKILVKNLLDEFGYDFLSEESKKILTDKEDYVFFDVNVLNFYKILLKNEVLLHQNKNKMPFVHNIYYKNISKRFKKNIHEHNFNNVEVKFYNSDIRDYITRYNQDNYDIVFLDGFTPAKCPCIWSIDFFSELYNTISTDSLLLTYNTSAPVRSAMLQAGFFIGDTYNNINNIVGTTASKNSSMIKHSISDKHKGLLNTKAGIPYRDVNLSLDNDTILLNRQIEVDKSDLISSSKYLKEWEKTNEK